MTTRFSQIGNHREGVCMKCDRVYCTWFAPSELWNQVMRPDRLAADDWPFVCMDCFAIVATEKGVKTEAWVVSTIDPYQTLAEIAAERVPA